MLKSGGPTLTPVVSPLHPACSLNPSQMREWVTRTSSRRTVQGDKDELISDTKSQTTGNEEGAETGSEKNEDDEALSSLAIASLHSLFFGHFTDNST